MVFPSLTEVLNEFVPKSRYAIRVAMRPSPNMDAYEFILSGDRDGQRYTVATAITGLMLWQNSAKELIGHVMEQSIRELERELDRLPIRLATADAAKLLEQML